MASSRESDLARHREGRPFVCSGRVRGLRVVLNRVAAIVYLRPHLFCKFINTISRVGVDYSRDRDRTGQVLYKAAVTSHMSHLVCLASGQLYENIWSP
ncbi:hypothetical protein J6590_063360 [Homalodisca vitripennis]|nr:hypothetical protein J6590_063360 [Homalodisca vitripennis]